MEQFKPRVEDPCSLVPDLERRSPGLVTIPTEIRVQTFRCQAIRSDVVEKLLGQIADEYWNL